MSCEITSDQRFSGLELKITEGKFGLFFSDEEREKMKSHTEEFKTLTTSIKK